jgi:hypothetical protein
MPSGSGERQQPRAERHNIYIGRQRRALESPRRAAPALGHQLLGYKLANTIVSAGSRLSGRRR